MTEVKQLITVENTNLQDIKIDQTVICDGNFFPQLEPKYQIKPDDKELDETFQHPHIYYQFSEDIDYTTILSKVGKIRHERNNHILVDKYTDDDAETQYLMKDPISYIILGKPEIGQVEVAKMLSDTWNCVNINPLKLITDELKSESRAGKCIAYNLEAGRAVEPEIILRLVEKRVKSQTAQHRGIIINGFPLVSNCNYKEDIISSESAVFNVQDIFEELIQTDLFPCNVSLASLAKEVSQVDEVSEVEELQNIEVEEEEIVESTKKKNKFQSESKVFSDIVDLGPSDINIVIKSETYHDLACPKKQMEFILKLFENKPLVIIYLTSDNNDIIRKRQNYRFNVSNELHFSINPLSNEIINDTNQEHNTEIDGTQMKYIVKLPYHFKAPVSSQLIQYRCVAKPIIDKKILYCDPEYFIKCDGRLSNINMFNTIQTRLRTLGFQYVLIPERLREEEKESVDDEFGSVHTLTAEDNKIEETFKNLRHNKLCGSMYKYGLSNWRYKCPVALKEGRIVLGKSEFAVKFMSKIYFLSDDDAMHKFYKNPRKYLLPVIPNPTCRIWIFGPRQTGKSAIAKCLSILYNCKILDLEEIEKNFESVKCFEYVEKLRTAAITEALVTINNNRKLERQETIDEWINESKALLNEIIGNKTLTISFSTSAISEKSAETVGTAGTAESNPDDIENFNFKLIKLNLPPYSEKDTFESLIKNEKELMKYLPEIFSRPIEPATVFDQFVKNYVKTSIGSAVIPDMSLSFDEKVDMIKNAIQESEDEYYQIHHTRGGWIIDGMFTDTSLLEKLCPEYLADDIICIKDVDMEHKFLIAKYLNADCLLHNDLTNFFRNIKRFSVAEKAKNIYERSHSHMHVINILNEIQERAMNSTAQLLGDTELVDSKNIENYMKSVNEFHQKWNLVKVYLDNVHKAQIIDINLENKSIQELLKEAVINIENKYRILANIMTEEDVKEDINDYTNKLDDLDDESIIEEDAEEGNVTHRLSKFFQMNRRLGNTNLFCPVVFDRYFVLWKGNSLYPVSFAQTVYYLSSDSAMHEFIADPRIFLSREYPNKIPPPRICIIGTTGSGKTSCAKVLADNYGLHYVNFDHLILQAFDLPLEDLAYIITMDPILDDNMLLRPDKLLLIKSYLENDVPLSKELIKQVLTPLWFQEPYVNVGFVLDNFPRRPSDVDSMIQNFFIPDIVLELFVNQKVATIRKYPLFYSKRKQEIVKYNVIMQEEFEMKFSKWQEDRYLRLQQLLEERWVRFQRKQEFSGSTQKLTTPIDSGQNLNMLEEGHEFIMMETEDQYADYDELQQKKDLDEANEILDKEMPMPVFSIQIPTDQEISASLHTLIETDYWRDLDYFEYIKQHCNDWNILYQNVRTSNKTAENVFYEVLRLTDQIRFRNKSFFERVYEITMEFAEKLLKQGFYFMSRFGRTCPVQRYENKNPIQMFLQHEGTHIYPLIYRRYIYFLHTEGNRDKFINDPIKYVIANKTRYFPLIPAKVAIIGAPKVGKSTLAERLKREYNLKLITRGSAIRYILENFPYCYLAKNIKKVVEAGWSATYEMTAKAVEALTLDKRSISQGYILDGFPESEEEMRQFAMLGIIPYVILDVRATKSMIYQNLETIKTPEPFRTYSVKFIDNLYNRWERNAYEFRQWLYNNYQNVKSIENVECKWHLCDQAKPHVLSTMLKLHEYLYSKNFEIPINLTTLCITPEEFAKREGVFRMFCPLCWYYLDILNDSGPFPDRRNVVQYLDSYYYICDKHRFRFFGDPSKFIPPRNAKLLPKNIPIFVDHNKELNIYHEDGLCISCFWDNQPKRVLKKGSKKFILNYKNKNYRFCSENCAKNFYRQPEKYCNLVINFRDKKKPDLCSLRKLPTLGYLEQLAGQLVIDAVINTEIERPFLAGLSIAQSAALHMGMYLKIHNTKASKESVQLYQEAKEKYDYRREKLKRKLEHFKTRINPFISVSQMRTEQYKYGPRYVEEDEEDFSEYREETYAETYRDTHLTYREEYEYEYMEE